MAVLHLGARLVPLAVTPLAGVSDVHGELLVDPLSSLIKRQLHDVLKKSEGSLSSFFSLITKVILYFESKGGRFPVTLPLLLKQALFFKVVLHLWN